ncbi:cupin domain-containing protein [Candidatus Colwellia aromaticivorans]|uniref:cupin domain-containing protein n=1 Tax=Candidatus Colwellia aromaticivorans TaxID=2267621 RepID=UPI000DF12FD0|nr:cupin domain-containing protein [Candidatus Colwellia aromaticivorans]
MSEKSIIKLRENPIDFGDITDEFDAAICGSTQSTQSIKHNHNDYKDEALGLYIGVYSAKDITETATPHAYDEFMIIIEGTVEIKNNKTGKSEIIMAGESFVIPHGYDCQWHQQGYLRKFYVIYEPPEIPEKSVTEKVVYIDENTNVPWKETSDGHRKKILYQNNNQRFIAGVWQSKAFTTGLIDFPYHEFIFINKGSLICTDNSGKVHYFKCGDALFIPQGTRCSWKVKGEVSIHFAQVK